MSTKFELAGGWSVWREVQLRCAGFPLHDLLGLDDLSKFVDDPKLREAVTWQNRDVVTHSLDRVVTSKGWKKRRRGRAVTSYLQRYYAKNEQIGFFGPVAWARFVDGSGSFEPSKDGLAHRSTHFELWAMQVWVEYLARQGELLPYLRPVLSPECYLYEGAVWGGSGSRNITTRRRVTPQDYSLLQRCDGSQTVQELGAAEALLKLYDKGLVELLPALVPDGYPERRLLDFLRALPDEVQEIRKKTETLVRLKEEVAAAAGDAGALYQALDRLESHFAETTGEDASCNSGMTYGSRSLVYEDCQRELELEIPQSALERVDLPLAGVLQAARWFTFEVACRHLQLFEELFQKLSGSLGDEISVSVFNRHLGSLFRTECNEVVASIKELLAQKWEQVFQGAHHLEGDEFVARCQRVFGAPCPGWPGARHQSPDIMFCASGASALMRGDFTAVLGELHPGVHTWSIYCVHSQHPEPERLSAHFKDDAIAPGLGAVPWEHVNRCIQDSWMAEDDIHLLDHSRVKSWKEPGRQVRLGDLVLRRVDGRLRAFQRESEKSFSILQLYERDLKLGSCTCFDVLGRRENCPRVTVGELVMLRARRFFPPSELEFANIKDQKKREAACRRFFQSEGFDRFLFAGIKEEKKPVFVDLESPLLRDLLCKLIRDTESGLSVSEMLPGPDELWFSDGQGRRYTSELRLIAVDPEQFDEGLVYDEVARRG